MRTDLSNTLDELTDKIADLEEDLDDMEDSIPALTCDEFEENECRDNEDNTDTEDYQTTDKLRPGSRERLSDVTGASNWGRRQEPDLLLNSSRQTTPLPPEPPSFPDHNQQHFSGDSQDSFSAKGYTSISVREPLAHIRDMRSLAGPGASDGTGAVMQEGNYVTLSDLRRDVRSHRGHRLHEPGRTGVKQKGRGE